MPSDRLIQELWGDTAPRTARKSIQGYVMQLRKSLRSAEVASGALLTRAGGYVLQLGPGELDLHRFERALEDGGRALQAGVPAEAARILREALALWRGPPLEEFRYEAFAQAEIARLEELRLAALEERIEADLALGRHAEVATELNGLVVEHPLRERLRAQLMLALYRCDRQATALEVYRDGRHRLADELGLAPSPALQRLEHAILTHDPELAWSATDRSADRRSGLPMPPNRTIRRRREIDTVVERLRAGSGRLLTLTGPGGVGKTRLAVEAALAVEAQFADGAYFISLAALRAPGDIPSAIVEALAIVTLPGESQEQAVERLLAAKRVLLVVDNFEHLLPAAGFVSDLLDECPGVAVLATSREPLNVSAEQRHPVPPLAIPARAEPKTAAELAEVAAVSLFVERAQARDPAFRLSDGSAAAVAELCRRLDGLPLAIELAAARCGLLSAAEIAERLDALLGTRGAAPRDAPARQQTLQATIEWSHQLLDDTERESFARFSVFAGGAALNAAVTITGADLGTIDGLVAKSLLVRGQRPEGSTRLRMLETIRAFAAERLARGDSAPTVRDRHSRYFLGLAEEHGNEPALMGPDGQRHLASLELEVDNLHGALAWAVGVRDARHALALCKAMSLYWTTRSRYAEALGWTEKALELPGSGSFPALRAWVLCIKAFSLRPLGRAAEQATIMAEAEAVARGQPDPAVLSWVLCACAEYHAVARRRDAADAFADQALDVATTAADAWAIAKAARAKAMAASTLPDLRRRVDRAASLLDEVGNVEQLGDMLTSATYVALHLDGVDDAMTFAERATPIVRTLERPFLSLLLSGNLGLAALLSGQSRAAAKAFQEELKLCRRLTVRPIAREGLIGLAAIAAQSGDPDRAARLVGASIRHRYGDPEGDVIAEKLDTLFFQPARTRHGATGWDAAAREGQTLGFEEAIAYALEPPCTNNSE